MSIDWPSKRLRFLVTGGSGFLGSVLVNQLFQRGARSVFVSRRADYDLRDPHATRALLRNTQPDIIFHLAANVGGIGANMQHPGDFFYDNAMMGLNVMHEAHLAGVKKLINVGTVCAYPKHTPAPFQEARLWDGYPEDTNAPYGIAKKALLVMGQAYRAQYGLNSIYLLPTNLYGPRDNFDVHTSHVIPAMIRRFLEAKEAGDDLVTLWGTGEASRDFLYVDDAAAALVLAAEKYDEPEPMNLGTGVETRIRRLAYLIADATGYSGHISWDASKPDGQPRRVLDNTKAWHHLGWTAKTPLERGLAETVRWWQAGAEKEGTGDYAARTGL